MRHGEQSCTKKVDITKNLHQSPQLTRSHERQSRLGSPCGFVRRRNKSPHRRPSYKHNKHSEQQFCKSSACTSADANIDHNQTICFFAIPYCPIASSPIGCDATTSSRGGSGPFFPALAIHGSCLRRYSKRSHNSCCSRYPTSSGGANGWSTSTTPLSRRSECFRCYATASLLSMPARSSSCRSGTSTSTSAGCSHVGSRRKTSLRTRSPCCGSLQN